MGLVVLSVTAVIAPLDGTASKAFAQGQTKDQALTKSLVGTTFVPDQDGFIRYWLILGPRPFAAGQGADACLDTPLCDNEPKLRPRHDEALTVDGRKLTWKAYEARDRIIDFHEVFKQQHFNCVAVMVCYITVDYERRGLRMRVGSDDQIRVLLNGKLIHSNSLERAVGLDQDAIDDITLQRGTNVLTVKIANTGGNWAGCVRMLYPQGDSPFRDFRISLTHP